MDINLIKQVVVTNRNLLSSIDLVRRDVDLDDNINYVFTGVRQAGKSYLMFQQIQTLLAKGITLDKILYVNFDDERLVGFTSADFDLILQAHYQLSDSKPIIFLDEPQNIEDWERFARRIANEKYRALITGSNAKMLSSEFATILGGRYVMKNVYPYSFAEFLKAKDFLFSNNWQFDINCINQIKRLFSDYFYYGGFPELVNIRQKRLWLSSLFKKMLLGDVIARNGVKNVNALTFLSKKLAESVRQPISYNRLANLVSSLGEKVQTGTMIDYVRHLKDACIIFEVKNIASQLVEKEGNKKYYYCDNGILNLFLMNAETALLENLVATELKRRYDDGIYFYNDKIEVDFVIPEIGQAIQVCYSLGDELSETYKRETQALLKISKRLQYNNLTIITYDEEERQVDIGGKSISIIPIWKWILVESKVHGS